MGTYPYVARKEGAPCIRQRRGRLKMGSVGVVDIFREGLCGDGDSF